MFSHFPENLLTEAVFRRVVANQHLDQRYLGEVLLARQVTLENIAVEYFGLRLRVMRIDKGAAHFNKVADLHLHPPAE